MLYAGRLVTGFGVGITSVVAPVLLSEIASPATRGSVTTLHQLNIVIGIMLAALVAYGFVNNVQNGWQYVQAFPCIPCGLMILFSPLIPESPKWIVLVKNDLDSATAVLKNLRAPGEDILAEVCG